MLCPCFPCIKPVQPELEFLLLKAELWNFLLLKDHQRVSRIQFTPGVFDTDALAAMELVQTDVRVTILGEVYKGL